MARFVVPGPLVIVGAGGFGRECLDIVEELNSSGTKIEFVGFTDDDLGAHALLHQRGVSCLGAIDSTFDHAPCYVIGIGDPAVRRRVAARLSASPQPAPVLVHPHATIGSNCRIGEGTILNAGARATTNITFGRHVQLHANCTVGHDAHLGDFVSVFPGATVSGAVEIGEGVTVGTGANILPGLSIGARSTIAAGAVVTRDVAADCVVAGVPARAFERNVDGLHNEFEDPLVGDV